MLLRLIAGVGEWRGGERQLDERAAVRALAAIGVVVVFNLKCVQEYKQLDTSLI